MLLMERWRGWARALKRESLALYFAMRDARTPWYAKVAAACVVAYALSPIDLIPDPIPVLGYLDDLVLIPLGVAIVRRLIPADVLSECRTRAEDGADQRVKIGLVGAAVIVALWLVTIVLLAWGTYGLWTHRNG
jgi:uncharacterized membrane protein YkvA (DUF1232 family)